MLCLCSKKIPKLCDSLLERLEIISQDRNLIKTMDLSDENSQKNRFLNGAHLRRWHSTDILKTCVLFNWSCQKYLKEL